MYVEFSYPIDPQNPILDGKLNPPRIIKRTRFTDGQSSNTSYIELFAHTGTHIDMPWHFYEKGWKINDFPIKDFVFERVLLLDLPRMASQEIGIIDLEPFKERIQESDALLVNTGFGKAYRWNHPETYLTATPGFSVEAAEILASYKNLRCVGVDFTSVENLQKNRPLGYPVHHAFLDREQPMILLEDANLAALQASPIKRIFLFPLRIEGLEASPVTAVAEI
jgi:kynurenine formamidase